MCHRDSPVGRSGPDSGGCDAGFSLVELLVVIVILGILATVVTFAVGGVVDRGEESACQGDRRTLAVAVESYFAQQNADTIADAGGPNGVEQTLVDVGLIRTVSEFHEVSSDGSVVNVAPCD